MTLTPNRYVQKPLEVRAVRVTLENMVLVSEWCRGQIKISPEGKGSYIYVKVSNPNYERQSQAYVGDWVLHVGGGWKVYTNKAFEKGFDLVIEDEIPNQPSLFEHEGDCAEDCPHITKRTPAFSEA